MQQQISLVKLKKENYETPKNVQMKRESIGITIKLYYQNSVTKTVFWK